MYHPATIDPIYWPYDNIAILPPASEEVNSCVTSAWKKAVTAHPWLYFKNRAVGFLFYLKIRKRVPSQDYWNATVSVVKNNYICIDDHHTPFTQTILPLWQKIHKVHFYDPWLWLLLNTVFFVMFIARVFETGNIH